jgi:hypothetical protein
MEKLALHTRLEIANYTFTDGALTNEIVQSVSLTSN